MSVRCVGLLLLGLLAWGKEVVVEGVVKDAASRGAIRKVQVRLTAETGGLALNVMTDGGGKFEFLDVPEGRYQVTLTHGLYQTRQLTISVREGGSRGEMWMVPLGAIRGKVLDGDGDVVEGAQVVVLEQRFRDRQPYWERWNATAITDENGEYRVGKLPPGKYLVMARDMRPPVRNREGAAPQAAHAETYYPNAVRREEAQVVAVAMGAGLANVDVTLMRRTLPPVRTVRGRVVGAPQGAERVSVALISTEPGAGGSSTSAEPPDYGFELKAMEGSYAVIGTTHVGNTMKPDAYGKVALVVNGDVAGVVVPLGKAPEVTGMVRTAEGVKLDWSKMRVRLSGMVGLGALQASPDATGRIDFGQKLHPGTYTLELDRVPPGSHLLMVKFGDREVNARQIEVTGSGVIEIVLGTRSGMVRGVARIGDQQVAAHATVVMVEEGEKGGVLKVLSDGDGKFVFENVRPGKYKLYGWEWIEGDRWQDPERLRSLESHAVGIEVEAGAAREVQLRVIDLGGVAR